MKGDTIQFGKSVIARSFIRGFRPAFFSLICNVNTHMIRLFFAENINQNPIFSLLVFESRLLICHHTPNFETL